MSETRLQEGITIDWEALKEEKEWTLFLQLARFQEICAEACSKYKPNILCQYLFDLARSYNTFYNDHSIKEAGTEELKQARLALSKAVAMVMEQVLGLLGMEVPEKM